MACDAELQFYAADSDEPQRIASQIMAEIRRIEAKYSRYLANSVVSQINLHAGISSVDIDAETAGLLRYADLCYQQSEGLFDITSGVLRRAWDFSRAALPDDTTLAGLLPLVGWQQVAFSDNAVWLPKAGMELDFGGFGKEYAVDQAADLAHQLGIRHGLVNLGGDLRVLGPQLDGQPWRVGIRHPRNAGGSLAALPMTTGALATSGDYERFIHVGGRRYCHILHPRTGYPLHTWQSVSVYAPRCLVAGSVSTMAMLKNEAAGEVWLAQSGLPSLAVRQTGEVLNHFN